MPVLPRAQLPLLRSGVARAAAFDAPYTMITLQPVKPEEWSAPRARAHTHSVLMHMHCRFCVAGTGEDPFLWRSARGWHMLYHCITRLPQQLTHFYSCLTAVSRANHPTRVPSCRPLTVPCSCNNILYIRAAA